MTAPDAPQVEPLTLTLEEAARSIAHEWMERLGYAPGIPEQAQRWLDAGEHEDFDAVYDLKKTLRFVRFVLERVPRDDIAELVEALAEPLRYFLEWREEIESDLGIWASKSQTREAFDQAEAALARARSEP